ncbi:hypothetical protein MIFL109517_11050 [Micrococcus flavus]
MPRAPQPRETHDERADRPEHPPHPAAGRVRLVRGHHHRVVRLLPLRPRRGARVQRPVLPRLHTSGRIDRLLRDPGCRCGRSPPGRHPRRALRRPRRTQVAPGGLPGGHGGGLRGHRPAADLRAGRMVVRRRAGAAALPAGPVRRHGVGRRRPDVRGARSGRPARLLRLLHPGRILGRHAPGHRCLHRHHGAEHAGAVRGVRLAHPVPGLRRARGGRPAHPPRRGGRGGVPAAAGGRRRQQRPGAGAAAPPHPPGAGHRRPAPGAERPLLPGDHLPGQLSGAEGSGQLGPAGGHHDRLGDRPDLHPVLGSPVRPVRTAPRVPARLLPDRGGRVGPVLRGRGRGPVPAAAGGGARDQRCP